MHLTTPSHWSRSIVTNGRRASERVVTIVGMRRRAQLSAENYNSCLADDNIKLLSILDRQSSRATLAPINT